MPLNEDTETEWIEKIMATCIEQSFISVSLCIYEG